MIGDAPFERNPMNRIVCFVCLGVWAASALAEDLPPTKATLELKTTRDQASYAIGQNIGQGIKNDGLDLNSAALVQGIVDALAGGPSKLTPQQAQAALDALRREVTLKMQEKARVEGEKNKKEGQAFLAVNRTKPGVVELPSGVQYVVLKSGNGPSPKLTDTVKTHYHGTLLNGKVFDSSVERGQPITFAVNGVIRGWTESLQKMKVGDKWRLFIPSESAYGADGAGADIGPHAVLIFEVELLGIEPPR
jgi:FKBP-type peptidyl-prolyl cis-trans isomerase FklB